jgi:hypothetical protein
MKKGTPEDMTAVLGLIQELADFWKGTRCCFDYCDDLVRDGFGSALISCL